MHAEQWLFPAYVVIWVFLFVMFWGYTFIGSASSLNFQRLNMIECLFWTRLSNLGHLKKSYCLRSCKCPIYEITSSITSVSSPIFAGVIVDLR
jgi:hypothetical protein